MDEEFAPNFKELFECTVVGKDIAEARFHAWDALEVAIGDLPMHNWKLAQIQHGIGSRPDPDFVPSETEGEEMVEQPLIPCVMTQAVWIYDPESGEGGTAAELLGGNPEPGSGDSLEIEKPELSLIPGGKNEITDN